MDLDALRKKVQQSKLLTEQERKYWLGNLTTLMPTQLSKLEAVVDRAAGLTWSKQMDQYMSIVQKGQLTTAA